MIDLHTHTTASDGRRAPSDLVARAATAGVRVLGVTDHDTVGGCAAAAAACAEAGISFVPGIEITGVLDDTDVHVLGYFIDIASTGLSAFLAEQRRQRIERAREMVAALGRHGIVVDADAIVEPGVRDSNRAVGRPWIARALVEHGHVGSVREAFDKWLSRGRPAFIPRRAAPPADVFEQVHRAGGIASLAHPGLLERDHWLAPFAAAGLDAVEAYYPEHDPATVERYLGLAARLGLVVSGGSDYHGDDAHGARSPGCTSLPAEAFKRLTARHAARVRAVSEPGAPR